jgi:hypothetical protein
MKVENFFTDLEKLEQKYRTYKEERKIHGNLDNVPYVMFLDYFKTKLEWEMHI